MQNFEDERIRRGLHREILLKTGIPRERRFQRARGAADARLVINMERRRIGLDDLPRLIKRQKRLFAVHTILFPRA